MKGRRGSVSKSETHLFEYLNMIISNLLNAGVEIERERDVV